MCFFFSFPAFLWLFPSRDHGAVQDFLGSGHVQKSTPCAQLVAAGFQKGTFSCDKSLQGNVCSMCVCSWAGGAVRALPFPGMCQPKEPQQSRALHRVCTMNTGGYTWLYFIIQIWKGLWTRFLHSKDNSFLQQEVQRLCLGCTVTILTGRVFMSIPSEQTRLRANPAGLVQSHWRHQH